MAIQYSQLTQSRAAYLTGGSITISISAKPTITRMTPLTALTGQAVTVSVEGYSFTNTTNVILSTNNSQIFPTTASNHSLTAEQYFDYFASKRGGANATRTHLSAYFPGVSGYSLSSYQILKDSLPYPEYDTSEFKSLTFTINDDNHISFILPPTEVLGNVNVIIVNAAGYSESNQIASSLTALAFEYPVSGLPIACVRDTAYFQVTGLSGIYLTSTSVSAATGSTYYYFITGGNVYVVSNSATEIEGNSHYPCSFLAYASGNTDCNGMYVELTSSTAASGDTYYVNISGLGLFIDVLSAGCWIIATPLQLKQIIVYHDEWTSANDYWDIDSENFYINIAERVAGVSGDILIMSEDPRGFGTAMVSALTSNGHTITRDNAVVWQYNNLSAYDAIFIDPSTGTTPVSTAHALSAYYLSGGGIFMQGGFADFNANIMAFLSGYGFIAGSGYNSVIGSFAIASTETNTNLLSNISTLYMDNGNNFTVTSPAVSAWAINGKVAMAIYEPS